MVQALSLSAQQRSLSAHRRLPSMAENEYVSGIGGAEEQAWETFQPDAYNTGMIGVSSRLCAVMSSGLKPGYK